MGALLYLPVQFPVANLGSGVTYQIPQVANKLHSRKFAVPNGLSLAYIGTDSRAAQRDEQDHRSSRFRLGDKKEAAGGAVAVISLGYMDIE
jgi:hypothetical protein